MPASNKTLHVASRGLKAFLNQMFDDNQAWKEFVAAVEERVHKEGMDSFFDIFDRELKVLSAKHMDAVNERADKFARIKIDRARAGEASGAQYRGNDIEQRELGGLTATQYLIKKNRIITSNFSMERLIEFGLSREYVTPTIDEIWEACENANVRA
jgi:hypothetical protein